jgi:hypothetical protein
LPSLSLFKRERESEISFSFALMMADCGETRIEKETITHFDFSSLPRKSVKMRKERERENCRHKRANSLI